MDYELFKLVTFKRLINNPLKVWSNTYEFAVYSTLGAQAIVEMTQTYDVISDFISFERTFHLPGVEFFRGVFSTIDDEGNASLDVFRSEGFNLYGQRDAPGEAMPLAVTLNLGRAVKSGRTGIIQYRGVLLEQDVQSVAGSPVLSNPEGVGKGAVNAFNNLLADKYLISGETEGGLNYVLVMANKAKETREIVGVELKGVGIRRLSRKKKRQETTQ